MLEVERDYEETNRKNTKSEMKCLQLLLAMAFALEGCTAFSCSAQRLYSRISHRTNSLNLSPVEAWSAYNDALEASPLLVKSVTASGILGAADLAGQALESRQKADSEIFDESAVDWARTARFAFFGLVLQAPWNHFYYSFLDGALPPTEEPWTITTGIKVVIDQFVQAPVFTILIFAFLGTLEGKGLEAVKMQLDEDYADTMVANWKLWVPATVINIAFVPPLLRVLYLNAVFFFWSIFLSLKLNKREEGVTEK